MDSCELIHYSRDCFECCFVLFPFLFFSLLLFKDQIGYLITCLIFSAINFAKQKATDVFDNGVSVSVFALDLPGSHFDQSKFWDNVIVGGDDEDTRVASMGDWEDLTAAITRKDHARRAMGNITLTLGEGLSLGVSVFTLVHTATKPTAIKLWKKTNEQVITD